jgi:tetratricopeptide (TPR) repeat protein
MCRKPKPKTTGDKTRADLELKADYELRALAKQAGISKCSKLKGPELIERLLHYRNKIEAVLYPQGGFWHRYHNHIYGAITILALVIGLICWRYPWQREADKDRLRQESAAEQINSRLAGIEQLLAKGNPSPLGDAAPTLAKEATKRGKASFDAGDYPAAIVSFTKAIDLDPNNAVAYCNRGMAYQAKSESDEAIADFSKAIGHDPNNVEAYKRRGIALYCRGIVYGAHKSLGDPNKAIIDYPKVMDDLNKAIDDLNKAIDLSPKDVAAYVLRGFIYLITEFDTGSDRAFEDFNKAIEIEPRNAKCYCARGAAYLVIGDNDKAIADLNKSIELDPTFGLAYSYRAKVYVAMGKTDKATQDTNRYMSLPKSK